MIITYKKHPLLFNFAIFAVVKLSLSSTIENEVNTNSKWKIYDLSTVNLIRVLKSSLNSY